MRVLLLLLALTATAQAQGISYIGLCNKTWDCKAITATWKGQEAIITGWLEGSFGSACKCADKLLQDARPKTIRVHLSNSSCLRNRRCGRQEVFYGETVASASRKVERSNRKIMKRFDKVVTTFKRRLSNAKGVVQCYVSPMLESDLSVRARRVLLSRVSAALPMCVPVDNPLRGACIKGYTCERHGSNPKLSSPCIADLDGEDGREVDLRKFKANTKSCDIRFYWEPFMNCNASMGSPFIDPLKRLCRTNSNVTNRAGRKSCRLLSHPSSDICLP